MTKYLFAIILSITYLFSANAQTWELLNESPFRSHHSIGFALNGIGYSVTGSINEVPSSRFYSYDPATDIFTQEDDFPGPSRGFGIGDTWDGKAYIGFGTSQSNGPLNDLWVFDPDNNTWTELASCPCDARLHPAFIANQGKIFVGMGNGATGNMNDWWEYDMATDSWSQKPDFPDLPRHHPYQFAVGDYVYTGFGHGSNINGNLNIFDELYRYDPLTEVWDQMKTLPAEGRVAGTQFSYGGKGYVLSGDGSDHSVMPFGSFWEYDPLEDEWNGMPSHPGSSRWAPTSFVIDDYVYFMNGLSLSLVEDLNVYRFYLGEGDPPTSIEELKSDEVIISPNPADNNINIQLAESVSIIENLSLFNLSGQLILERTGLNNNSITLDIENIPTGAYYLKIESGDEVISQKIIKQ
ncbi:MAG: T9SS type A sorting domain-containing protein [Saprospiraceae bacterium]|nr:T9SS type A sorting domain-containing protein [Saprospiraceae bacterium]MDG2418992.1 T9SS type A sorting domain-containing protein [Saprospiraceae bacterium]